MKRKNLKILVLMILFSITFILISNNIAFANIDSYGLEKTEAFKKWENLSEEERKNTIQPMIYKVDLKSSILRSKYNNILGKYTSNMETRYDIREQLNLSVKNQKMTGSCWAFSFSSMIEAYNLKNNLDTKEFSPMHVDYVTANLFNRNLGEGGNSFLAFAYTLDKYGPTYEENFPFESVYDEVENYQNPYYLVPLEQVELTDEVNINVKDTIDFPSIYKKYDNDEIIYTDASDTEYTKEQVTSIRDSIKKQIKQNGSVTALLYSDIQLDQNNEFVSEYMNLNTNAFYNNDNNNVANHEITIVGWDDEYDITNFNSEKQPKNKGAYIALNSYGKEFGDEGYFYISYDDAVIEQQIAGIIRAEKNENTEEKIYQYDELGYNYAITFGGNSTYSANIFNRNSIENEYVTEIVTYVPIIEGIEVYINPNDDNLDNLELVATTTPNQIGYTTIKLASPVKLNGEKFVVGIKYINQEGAIIPLESNLCDSQITLISNYFDKAIANDGESLISLDGKEWQDINGTKVGAISTLKNTNNCIKAITSIQDIQEEINVTEVQLDKTEIALKEGKTETLIATVLPENATNKNITWTSSNNDIAIVENGVITAIKEGNAIITVMTQDGSKTATCNVLVEKKEQEDTKVSVETVELNKTNLTIKEGKTETLIATVLPENATNKNVAWTSSNNEIATVENGVITAIKEGNTVITVITQDGNKTATCNVNVEKAEEIVRVEDIKLNKTELEIQVGDTANLEVTITPTNATNKNIIWYSSDESIITISERGIMQALKTGTAIITAESEDGSKVAECKVTVVKKQESPDDIYKEDTTNKEDTTIAKDNLPSTGIKAIIKIVIVLAIAAFGITIFIKLRKLNDIK